MSWILGVISENISEDLIQNISKLHPSPIHTIRTNNIYISSGGIRATCLSKPLNDQLELKESGWLVVGLGIKREEPTCRFLTDADWQQILKNQFPELSRIDGHFIVVKWQGCKLECFSDQLGLRTLYFSKKGKNVIFSTRLDWVSRLIDEVEIDFSHFGSHWMTYNQLSYASFLKGVERLGPGGVAKCTNNSIVMKNSPLLPECSPNTSCSLEKGIEVLLNPEIEDNSTLSLGLSGGLDSRLLFACLTAKNRKPFSLHLFGHNEEPDVMVARRIAKDFKIKQNYFYQSELSVATDFNILRDYVVKTSLVVPVSNWFKLHRYSELHKMGKIVIDGGFGEIARRQYLNRLFWFGRRQILSGYLTKVFPYIKLHRASIFNGSVINAMNKGITQQLIAIQNEMPDPKKIGVENFLDLLAVRYRVPNMAGMDQARLDEEIVSYMPYAQPSFIQNIFRTSLELRRGGKLFRDLIYKYQPNLARYPLVKGTTKYPYILKKMSASVYVKLQTSFCPRFENPLLNDFLIKSKKYINELVISEDVKTFSAYNHQAIKRLVKDYYEGKTNLGGELEWWLSFEFWRQALQDKNV